MPAETHVERSPDRSRRRVPDDPGAPRRDPGDRGGPHHPRLRLRRPTSTPTRSPSSSWWRRWRRSWVSARSGFSIDDEDLGDLHTVRDAVDYVDAPLEHGVELDGRSGGRCRRPGTRCAAADRARVGHSPITPSSTARSRTVRTAPSTASRTRTSGSSSSVTPCSASSSPTYVYERVPRSCPRASWRSCAPTVVSAETLAEIAQELDLGASLRLGKGEDASGGRAKPSILADAMEAVIAAVYLDGGLEPAARLVLAVLGAPHPRAGDRPGRAGLQDAAAGARGPAVRSAAPLPGAPRGPRPLEAVLRRGVAPQRGVRRGRGTFEEGGRAGRRTRCVGTVAGRGEQRLPRPGGPYRGGGCLSFRKSKCCDGTSSERSSARR